MNSIFRIIWNRTLGRLVVASEAARSNDKAATQQGLVGHMAGQLPAPEATSSGVVALLRPAFVAVALAAGSMTLMAPSAMADIVDGTGSGTSGQAVGCDSANAENKKNVALGCGSYSYDPGRLTDRNNPDNTIPTDMPSGELNHYGVAVGADSLARSGGVAIGERANNTDAFGIAIGASATASENASMAIGAAALSTGMTSLAVGRQSVAEADYAQAIGHVSVAKGKGSLAMGHSATASGYRAIAIGSPDIENAGDGAGAYKGANYQSDGQSLATGTDSIAFGGGAQATSDKALAIGAFSTASGLKSVAIGDASIASAENAFAMGEGALADVDGAVALGQGSEASIGGGFAGFEPVNASSADKAAIQATQGTTGAVSVGSDTVKRQITNLAAGSADSDAVNVAQLKAAQTQYYSVNDDGTQQDNYNNDGATGLNAMAAGPNAEAVGASSVAMGDGAKALGYQSTKAIAIGPDAIAEGGSSVAMGDGATTGDPGNNQVAIGKNAFAEGENSIAIGNGAESTSGQKGMALGAGAKSEGSSVALGADSIGDTDFSILQTNAYSPTGDPADISAPTAGGEVSIGSGVAGDFWSERRITNVAAGLNDTDAVNVSQLKAAGTRYYSVNDTTTPDQDNYLNDGAEGEDSMAAGIQASTSRAAKRSTALGYDASVEGVDSVAIGSGSTVNVNTVGAVALGFGASAGASNTVSIGKSSSAAHRGAIAIGDSAFTTATESVAIGSGAEGRGPSSVSVGRNTKAYAGAVAAGYGAEALEQDAIAIGRAATASKQDSIALGGGSQAKKTNSTALGKDSVASLEGAVALGSDSISNTASGQAGYVLASASTADKAAVTATTSTKAAVSVGKVGDYRQIVNLAAGTKDTDAVNVSQLKAVESLIGDGGGVEYYSVNSAVAGNKDNLGATGVDAMAAGPAASAVGNGSVAVGNNSKSVNLSSVSVGQNTGTEHAFATGTTTTANVAVGSNAGQNTQIGTAGGASEQGGNVALGANVGNNTKGYGNIAVGSKSTGSNIENGWNNIAIGMGSGKDLVANANGNIALGNTSGGAVSGANNVAIGTRAGIGVTNSDTTSIGINSLASGTSATAIGSTAKAENTQSTAVGFRANASGNQALALGNYAASSSTQSIAIGTSTEASAARAFAAAKGAKASAADSMALGSSSVADKAGAVALGSNSATDGSAATVTTATVNGLTYGGFSGEAKDAGRQVSVGRGGDERQIKNLAAGEISASSTDAINGSQLYATNDVLGNLADSVVNNFGGNAEIKDADGNITFTDIGDTGKKNIHDAIKSVKTEVAAGTNVANVVETSDPNTGAPIYTVNADGASVSAGSSSVEVTAGTKDPTTNVTDYKVDLSADTKDKIDNAIDEIITQVDGGQVKSLSKNDNEANFVSGKNIQLSGDEGSIVVATKDVVEFTDATVNNNLTVGGTTQLGDNFTVNNDNSVDYTGPITEGDNITNKTYVDGGRTVVAGGTNVAGVEESTDAATGQKTYTVNADGASVSVGSDALTVAQTADDTTNITDYKLDLSQDSKDSLAKADTAMQSFTTAIGGTEVQTVEDGGQVNFVAGQNIDLTDDAGSIKVATSDVVSFTDATVTNNLTVGGTTQLGDNFTVNKDGSTDYDVTIDNSTGDTSLVNKKYVDFAAAGAKTVVVAGTNVAEVAETTDPDTGTSTYTVNAEKASVSAGSAALTVADTEDTATNVTDYAVDLSQESKDSLAKADTAMQSFTTAIGGTEVQTVEDGGQVNFVAGQNIDLTDDAGSIKVATSDVVSFTDATVTNNLTVGGTTQLGDNFTVNKDGSTDYDVTIDNSTGDTSLVNKKYVDFAAAGAKTVVVAGTNVADVAETTDPDTGTSTYTVNAEKASVSAGSAALTVADTEDTATNVTDYAVDLSQESKDSLAKADTAMQSFTTAIGGTEVQTVEDGDQVNFVAGQNIDLTDDNGSIKVATSDVVSFTDATVTNNLTVGGTTKLGDNFTVNKDGSTDYDVTIDKSTSGNSLVNKKYIDDIGNNLVTEGLKFAGNKGDTIHKELGQTLTIEGGLGDAEDASDANIRVDEEDGKLSLVMARNLKDLNSITINNGGPVINQDGINMGGKQITNLGSGMTDADGKKVDDLNKAEDGNAANIGDLKQVAGDINKNVAAAKTEVTEGKNISVTESKGDDGQTIYEVATADEVDFDKVTVGGDDGLVIDKDNVDENGDIKISGVGKGDISGTSTDAVNGSQLWEVQNQITNIEVAETKYFKANSEAADANAAGKESVAMGPKSVAQGDNSVAAGNGAISRTEGSVALGAGSVADREGMSGKKEAFSNISVASTQGAVSVGSKGNERQITNVAGGTESTDAVNVRQLKSVQAGSVNYDRNEDGSIDYGNVSLGNGEQNTVIHNVAPGQAPTDAANVGQLQSLNQRFTNEINSVHNRIDEVERDANAGIAGVAAMGNAPYVPGKFTYHVGGGYHGGESAVGVNFRRTADNGRWSLTAGAAGSRAGATISLGVSGVID